MGCPGLRSGVWGLLIPGRNTGVLVNSPWYGHGVTLVRTGVTLMRTVVTLVRTGVTLVRTGVALVRTGVTLVS